jgi:DNA-binding NtrC family response regulator
MTGNLLFVDDDPAVCDVIQATLRKRGFRVDCRHTGQDALLALEQGDFDVVITDLQMPGMAGAEFCRLSRANWPDRPVIVVTAFGSVETAVTAIRAGAYDFIAKPIQLDELLLTLQRALEQSQLKQENKRLRQAVITHLPPGEMLGESPVMQKMYSLLHRIEDTHASVLITGESGTGKELVARTLHARSPHASGPLVAINCAAVPEGVLESELFGHVRGAFTDAKSARAGLFLQASGGTLFLDEIGEMPRSLQAKLLRAIQERTVRPVGGDREVAFDARIVAATSRDLETEVAEHRFREDLYYRINVIRVDVPPLRARGTDILRIAEHYVATFAARLKKQVAGITRPVAERLLAYSWPGNVRELQNCIERAVALTAFEQIVLDDLPDKVREFSNTQFVLPIDNPSELLPIAEVERRYILQVLQAVSGSRTQAAEVLGMDRRTLYRKLKLFAGE